MSAPETYKPEESREMGSLLHPGIFGRRHPQRPLALYADLLVLAQPGRVVVAKIERDVITRGVFTSVPDLRRKLMRYIRHYNKAPKTIKWRYRDPSRRITLDSVATVC